MTLSSFGSNRQALIPKPYTNETLSFLSNGKITEWTIGSGTDGQRCWLQIMSTPSSITPPASIADHFFSADKLYIDRGIKGGFPPGDCLGYTGKARLPGFPGYYANGWLNREGVFFPCDSYGHDALAELLFYGVPSPVRHAERSGWARISDSQPLVSGPSQLIVGSTLTLSDAQCQWLLNRKER